MTRAGKTGGKMLTLAAMSLGYGVVQLDVTIVNTALSNIGGSLGGGIAALQWVVSVYTIAFAALILSAGALGDRLGAKRVFMGGFAVFTAASLACAAAGVLGLLGLAAETRYWTILAPLLALGGGLGLLVPPLTSSLLGSVEKARSGIAAGVLNATRQTGSVLGVALMGALIGRAPDFLAGARSALILAALVLTVAALVILGGTRLRRPRSRENAPMIRSAAD